MAYIVVDDIAMACIAMSYIVMPYSWSIWPSWLTVVNGGAESARLLVCAAQTREAAKGFLRAVGPRRRANKQ